ncbi:putative exported domain protein, partial [Chlamydia psittaci 06-1683]
MLLNKSSLSI